MSQSGAVNFNNNIPPSIATIYNADTGSATPALNILNLIGSVVSAGSAPFSTSASGNTVVFNAQLSQAIAAADVMKVGMASFDSSSFSVDVNGFVSLVGGGEAIDSFIPDSGTSPVVPDVSGQVSVIGSGSTTTVGGLNSLTVQLQGLTNHAVLVGAGTTTITKLAVGSNGQVLIGATAADPAFATLTSSDSSISFTTGANTLSLQVAGGTTVGKTITGDSGGALSPTAGNWNLLGTTNQITTTGAGSTLTFSIPSTFIGPGTVASTTTMTAGTGLTVTTGNAAISAGNLTLPATNAGLTQGVITIASGPRLHGFGTNNVFLGATAGNGTLTGTAEVGIGTSALASLTSGSNNIAIGVNAATILQGGGDNIAIGVSALTTATSAGQSTAVGRSALRLNVSGTNNTAFGYESLRNVLGSNNTAIGYQTGTNYTGTEANNILIGSGVNGTLAESNVTRIGASQNTCFIDGIDGVNVGSVAKVVTMASDQLGTATITAGTGVSIGTSANTITVNAVGGGITWSVVTVDASFTVNTGTIANKSGLLTMTLPASAAVGDIIRITGINTALGWKIAQNANQQIFFGTSSTTLGAGGSLASAATRDSVELVCVVAGASTVYNVISSVGNITIV